MRKHFWAIQRRWISPMDKKEGWGLIGVYAMPFRDELTHVEDLERRPYLIATRAEARQIAKAMQEETNTTADYVRCRAVKVRATIEVIQ